ncbi:RES domain-containing protein [Salmonella enterica]|nr:RES domain-containing protein [Salmonella enterica]
MTIPVHAYAWQRTEKVVNNYRANQGVDILEKIFRSKTVMNDEKYICHACIGEKYVKAEIKTFGSAGQECSYCHKRFKNVPVSHIAGLMNQVFEDYYEPREADYYFGTTSGSTAQEVICDELKVDDEDIITDIYDCLCDEFNDYQDIDPPNYNEDYVYTGRGFSSENLSRAWKKMIRSLNEEARFFNRTVKVFLDDLFVDLKEFKTEKDESPIQIIDGDTALYRARVFETLEEVEEALTHPERNFGPPPPDKARSGRMNAQGISVFYGATTQDVAISEVRPPVGSRVVVAAFRPLKEMRILDISALDTLIFSRESVFNPKTIRSLERTAFLKTFSRKMTLPVFGKRQDSEYLITQAIAEYLSVSEKYQLDGISFRSTQVKREAKGSRRRHKAPGGYNIVLFSKSAGVKHSDKHMREYQVRFMHDFEDEPGHFHPSIHQVVDAEPERDNDWEFRSDFMLSQRKNSLEMVPDGLTYYHIQGVSYQKTSTEIEQGMPVIRPTEKRNPI